MLVFACGLIFGLACVAIYHSANQVAAQLRKTKHLQRVNSARLAVGTPLQTGAVTMTGTVVLRATSNAELVNEIGFNFGEQQ